MSENILPFKKENKLKLDTPFKIIDVLGEVRRDDQRYIIRDEILESKKEDGQHIKMTNCYSLDSGHYIGGIQEATFLCERQKLTLLQRIDDKDETCSIGFNQTRNKWYGWNDTAVCDFGIGDMLFDTDFKPENDNVSYRNHGTINIINTAQAKQAAINFARHTS